MTELMNELHSVEEVLIKTGSINMAEVKANPRNNGPNANKTKKKVGPEIPSTKKDGKPKREMLRVWRKESLEEGLSKTEQARYGTFIYD